MQRCSQALIYKLQARTDYDSLERDPVLLIKAIEEASMNYCQEEYKHKTVFDALKHFVNLKQHKDEC